MFSSFRRVGGCAIVLLATSFGGTGPSALGAQSPGAGRVVVSVRDTSHRPMAEVTVTLERAGAAMRVITTGRSGVAEFAVVAPGLYSVLAEQFGYQPVRMLGITVIGAGTSQLTIELTRHPPPITSVVEIPANVVVTGAPAGQTVTGDALALFNRRYDISGVVREFAQADVPLDGRAGFLHSANGLLPTSSRLVVDGVRESLFRQPGIPDEPASSPLFARDAIAQLSYLDHVANVEWPGTPGAVLDADTRRGAAPMRVVPWFAASSAGLGGRAADNPGDSSATSMQGGVSLSGPIKHDTASYFIDVNLQRLRQPTADPFDGGSSTADRTTLYQAVRTAATTVGSRDVTSWLSPTVRGWQGGSGAARLDWRFGARTLFAVRAGFASWTEDNPQVGHELVNNAGTHLAARDVSGAASLITGSDRWSSDTRFGVHVSKRDWTSADLPYTGLTSEAIAFGSPVTLPGTFRNTAADLTETMTLRFGDHALKVGGELLHRQVNYDWLPASAGRYLFGSAAEFGALQGAFYRTTSTIPAPDIELTDIAGLIEDRWQTTRTLQLTAGVRLEHQSLPSDVITFNPGWARVAGITNALRPGAFGHSGGIGAQLGFDWDASGDGHTSVRGAFGLVPGQYDVVALAEAAQFDGGVTVQRANGALAWPTVGAPVTPDSRQALTLFGPDVRPPRSYKMDLSLTQQLGGGGEGGGVALTLSGGYRHADYLLQRTDLNRAADAASIASDGRPIFGTLEQYGSLLTPTVGSNRRFPEFDFVYGLSSSGYTDYYQASVSIERRLTRQFGALLTYTWSRTTDNLPGQLSADPADRLTPFPDGLNGARWEDGRSDLDIPSRVAGTLTYHGSRLAAAARVRYRSGLPFTPGFRYGIDANADGSVGNDPASIANANIAGSASCLAAQVGHIAERNSCRDPGVYSVDLHAAVTIAHGWALEADAFNVVGSTTGLYDHAAVLVDPSHQLNVDAAGHTILPIIANPSFGNLLSRRGLPRVIRVGIRLENW